VRRVAVLQIRNWKNVGGGWRLAKKPKTHKKNQKSKTSQLYRTTRKAPDMTESAKEPSTQVVAHVFDKDVSETAASLVLPYVLKIKDRLSLACVSRAWRKVATAPSCWKPNDRLLLEGPLAARLTDVRVSQLLSYAGLDSLQSLVIHIAPAAFTSEVLLRATKLLLPKNLQTLDLSWCPGVKGENILDALRLFIADRDKDERLDRLGIAGCAVTSRELILLQDCVRHTQPQVVPTSTSSFSVCVGFDVGVCAHCDAVVDEKSHRCVTCDGARCLDPTGGESICKFCSAFACTGCLPETSYPPPCASVAFNKICRQTQDFKVSFFVATYVKTCVSPPLHFFARRTLERVGRL
jgi:hypothetical protein